MSTEDQNIKQDTGVKALRAGVWYTVSNISTKAIMVISTPIFTRMMTKHDYGVTATFTSWYNLFVTFCTLNLQYSIGRAKIDYPTRLNEYVGTMQIIAGLASTVLAALGLLFLRDTAVLLELPHQLVILLMIYLIAAPTITLYQSKFKYQYRYKENILITLYTTVASVVLSLALVSLLSENRYNGRVLGIVLPTVLLSAGLWLQAWRKYWLKWDTGFVKYGLDISLPLILNGLSLSILGQSDRVVITKICGSEPTAVYTIAYQLSILVSLVLDSIGQAWLPWFHDTYAAGDYAGIRKNMKPLILFGCYIGLGCVTIAPEAIYILGGDSYRDGIWVVAPVTLGLVCKFIYANYEHIELHLKKTAYIGVGTAAAAVLNIVLNLIYVPQYGFAAAGYTTFFSYFVLMIIHYFITTRLLRVRIYDNKFMFAMLAGVTLAAFAMMRLYQWIIPRYCIIVIISLGMLWLNRDIIVRFLSKKH